MSDQDNILNKSEFMEQKEQNKMNNKQYENLFKEIQKNIDNSKQSEKFRKELPLQGEKYPEENFFYFLRIQNRNYIRLNTYRYQTCKEECKGLVLVYHGLSQHINNSAHIAKQFADNKYIVCGFDQRGFGKSQGIPGYIENIDTMIDDSLEFVKTVQQLHPNLPTFLMGESMGGMVTYNLALKYRNLFNGVILLNPAIMPTTASSRFGFLAKFLGKICPQTQLLPRIKGNGSKNPLVDEYLNKDPFYYKQRHRPGTTMNLILGMEQLPKTYNQFDCPFLIVQGGSDKIVNFKQAYELMENCKTNDKTLIFINSLWHCSWLEEEINYLIPKMIQWCNERINNQKQIKEIIQNKQ